MIRDLRALFFEEPLRMWHFEAIIKEAKISRERANYFLKKLINEGFIIKKKQMGKMPYYVANVNLPEFRIKKKLYGLSLLEEAGLFESLCASKTIKSAILFGSFARGDWGKSSDVDLFVYGDAKNFDKWQFERKLEREIQVFSYDSLKNIKRDLGPKLLPNIMKGFNIKGNLEPFRVNINAQS